MTLYQTEYHAPLGRITLASDGEALSGLWIEEQLHFAATAGKMIQRDDLPVFREAKTWLDRYFSGERPRIQTLPLAPVGSPFRQAVWKILMEIPYGEVITYGEISKALGTGCAQAVGGAVGHNPISIIIPCHRVIGAGGNLTGYAGGLDKKIWLLRHEGVDMMGMYLPK